MLTPLYITLRICNQASINNQMTENRWQTTDDRKQMADDRRQTTEDRRQMTENRWQTTEDRGQMADDRRQMSENRSQRTENEVRSRIRRRPIRRDYAAAKDVEVGNSRLWNHSIVDFGLRIYGFALLSPFN
jgi:hypothetical protein